MHETILGGKVTLHCGDALAVLRTLPSNHFHCVVSSPPYWGLRNYGVDGQLGLERSLGEHVAIMTEVFQEVRRVLRPDGTLWLNYGDSYATSVNGRSAADTKLAGNDDRTFRDKPFSTIGPIYDPTPSGAGGSYESERPGWAADRGRIRSGGYLKPKDLCGIPWRVAFALQADGWWLRQDIIWSKPNPMPESIRDRCTKAHEYIFLFAKSERYYFDQETILEPLAATSTDRLGQNVAQQRGSDRVPGKTNGMMKAVGRASGNAYTARAYTTPQSEPRGPGSNFGFFEKRNKRSVWEVATQPFSEAHFATFPPALIEPCILAGCPVGGEVLDPFGGAGTTALVAASLGRRATLIELNPEYCRLAKTRLEAAYMGADEGKRHMAKQLGKTEDPGPLFAGIEYDPMDDMRKSIELGFKVIRERMANGGEPWTPKSTDK